MRMGTIGAGEFAQAFAKCVMKAGHEVNLSNARGPESLREKGVTMNTHEEVMPSKPMSTAPASSAGPRSGSRPWTLALTSVAVFMVALDMLANAS